VDCKEFQEQVSPAVDKLLSQQEMARFVEHAKECSRCRYEYQTESATKALVCQRAGMVQTPREVVERISQLLERERQGEGSVTKDRWKQIVWGPVFKPALGLGVVVALVLLLFTIYRPPSDTALIQSSSFNNVISQSLENYGAVVDGSIKPQLVSNQPELVKNFFSGRTEFPVLVPGLKGCELVGGVLNQHSGTNLAHVVYVHDGEVVYMYEACWETVMKGEKLNLPAAAKEELMRTGWFSQTEPDGKTLVLWTKGKTLCAAVSRMKKNDLMACLASAETSEPGAW
jgi:hypothetical protein